MAAINCNFDQVLKGFDPDQPRSADGKWTAGGGGGFQVPSAWAREDAAHFAAHPSDDPKAMIANIMARKPASVSPPPAKSNPSPQPFTQMPLGSFGKAGPSRGMQEQLTLPGSIGRMRNAGFNRPPAPGNGLQVSQLLAYKPMEPGGTLRAKPMPAPFPIKNLGAANDKTQYPDAAMAAEAERNARDQSADASAEDHWQNGLHSRGFYLHRARVDRGLTEPSTPPSTPSSEHYDEDDDPGSNGSSRDGYGRQVKGYRWAPNLDAPTPAPAIPLTDHPEEQRLGTTKIESTQVLKGSSSEVHKITYADGSEGAFKPDRGEEEGDGGGGIRPDIRLGLNTEREVAAWKVAKLVGMDDMVTPAIDHTIDGVRGAMTTWAPGSDARNFSERQKYDGKTDAARAAAFDYVIGNQDRHGGNWKYDPDGTSSTGTEGKMMLYDHNLAFPEGTEQEDSSFNHDQYFANTAMIDHMQRNPTQSPSAFAAPYVNKSGEIFKMMGELGFDDEAIKGVGNRIDRLANAHSWGDLTDHEWNPNEDGEESTSESHVVGSSAGTSGGRPMANPIRPSEWGDLAYGNKNPAGGVDDTYNRNLRGSIKPGQLTWDNMNTDNWHRHGMPPRPSHDARFPTAAPPKPPGTMDNARAEYDDSVRRHQALGKGLTSAFRHAGSGPRGNVMTRAGRMREAKAHIPSKHSMPSIAAKGEWTPVTNG